MCMGLAQTPTRKSEKHSGGPVTNACSDSRQILGKDVKRHRSNVTLSTNGDGKTGKSLLSYPMQKSTLNASKT